MRPVPAMAAGAAVLMVALVAATAAFLRWEIVREPVPGLPLPARSVVAETDVDDAREGGPCQLVVDAAGAPDEVMARWWGRLRAHAWESAPADIERTVFRRPGQRLLVNVIELPGLDPWTRLRITLRPCRLPENGGPS